ncbi:hypothetical protein EUTSA_v10022611mg [Eutrema salsugineum]|uniref:Phorbol-ester/DAG-type domain-containing protein n=1 Tax=Eutrema salsugineum TaxID=72664 RepID=V4ME03_EUTSA|nr:uncharacterized protein LOC18026268 [Eutrema salsugineum]ESQ50733.1 hypothetical protein EUTSA_v10022611mg [Eutrema salsugineum]
MQSDDEEEGPVCRLSHPAHPHTLSYRTGGKPPSGCFASGKEMTFCDAFYYLCKTCDVEFHDRCHMSPRKMTHPFHPQHPLVFSVLNHKTMIIYECNLHEYYDEGFTPQSGIPDHGNVFETCTWCGGNLKDYSFFYRCSICNFCLDPPCSKIFPLPTIPNPKSHHHSLFFLPRPLLLPCDACGLVEKKNPSYTCLQCNYIVHESCIDLPRIIKITRHPHRLFYRPFLSPTLSSSCRLCYKTVDIKYGQYSCNHEDCSYVAHSKCSTHTTVWDGSELEWEPEESVETEEDVAPFKRVGDDLIIHFCHEHHLRLDKYNGVRDAEKQCQACTLHIDSRDFYNCVQCDYFLHEVCANLPRKLDHALHNHPLVLDPSPPQEYSFLSVGCSVCSRAFTGFRYKCCKDGCGEESRRQFQVDVRCILVPDYFTHKSHEHPLFIPISTGEAMIFCASCERRCAGYYLQCTLCDFAICYECATIPNKLHNKYDVHQPLSLCYGDVSDETYWCEVCEEEIDQREWFYTCNKPCITIHRSCLFGSFAYMKPGYTFHYNRSLSVKVVSNTSNTRPICHHCGFRCSSSVYLELSTETHMCSFSCLTFLM